MVSQTIIQIIQEKIREAIIGLNWPENESWQVYISEKPEHGHYATNVAMVFASQMKKPPMVLASEIKAVLEKEFQIEIVEPGFVNFFLSAEFINKAWQDLTKNLDKQVLIANPKKIQVEFVSANPTGPLTLGNGRGGFFGDVLANILKRAGHQVVKEYYVNDGGFQVKRLGESILDLPDAPYQGEYIEKLRQTIKAENPTEAGEKGAKYILEEMIKPDIEKIGIDFDVWFSEKTLYEKNLVDETLKILKKKDLVVEQDGAIWLKTTLFGDEKDRVLVKASGEMTYLMTDLAYHRDKFGRGFELVIDIWGADHQGHVEPLLQGLEALGQPSDSLKILIGQWVKVIKDGQELIVSKRRGEYITIVELVDQVGLDATRYFFLERSLNSHLNFDLNLAIKKSSENPVYYIQYAHARINSILKKAEAEKESFGEKSDYLLSHSSELNLMMQILHYPEIIRLIANNYEVHKLPQYAYNLASAFHQFYRDCPVIGSSPSEIKSRLALLITSQRILKESLGLMGISAPDKM
jgi:arginyl-tRNA synthetase